jgi:hypothetical protein
MGTNDYQPLGHAGKVGEVCFMSRIAIYDVDSSIPNLALMKISAHHKSLGDSVEMYSPLFAQEFEKVYASKVFDFSDGSFLDPGRMIIGGTGWDLKIELPPEIEALTPDYSIYDYPHSIGFTMRGCRLRCSFCVVPQKEGKPHSTNTIGNIWTQRDSDFIVLLDNDFFGNPEWADRIAEIREHNLKVNFSQGLNIRNLKPEQAQAIASVRFRNLHQTKTQVHFAWDDPRHEKLIHKGIKIAVEGGIKTHQMAFYVLIGYHSTPEEDLHRVEVLRGYGCDPYAMPYDKSDDYQSRFTRWVNHKAIFKSVNWSDYASGVKSKPVDERQQGLFIG